MQKMKKNKRKTRLTDKPTNRQTDQRTPWLTKCVARDLKRGLRVGRSTDTGGHCGIEALSLGQRKTARIDVHDEPANGVTNPRTLLQNPDASGSLLTFWYIYLSIYLSTNQGLCQLYVN